MCAAHGRILMSTLPSDWPRRTTVVVLAACLGASCAPRQPNPKTTGSSGRVIEDHERDAGGPPIDGAPDSATSVSSCSTVNTNERSIAFVLSTIFT